MLNPKYPMITKYTTNNPCYKQNTQITVTSLVLHSIGCNQPSASNMRNRWDRAEATSAVSAVCDDKECYIMLPCEKTVGKATKNWGVGKGTKGSMNTMATQIEMCESKYNKYINGYTVQIDPAHIKEAVEYTSKCLDVAIEWLAQQAFFHKLNVLGKDKYGNPVLMSHIESNKVGFGSAHSDISQLEKAYKGYLDLSMDTIRKRVASRVEELKIEEEFLNMDQKKFDSYLLNASPEVIDKLMSAYEARLAKLPVSNWAIEDVKWAMDDAKIMSGGTGGGIMPKLPLDREMACALFHRFYEKLVKMC